MPTHVTAIFVTEALHLSTYIQLFQMTIKVKVMAYTVPAYCY